MPRTITATGSSDVISFDDAFRDALERIGKNAPNTPDYLLHVKLTEIKGEFGGIDGRTRLLVTLTAEV